MEFSNINLYKDKIGIYRIVNTQNNHVYVGQTRQNFFRRYLHHQWKLKNGSHDNTYLQNAWNLYGAESFVFEVVECVTNPDVLNDLEIAYIRRYRAIGSCYNLSSGGGGRSGVQLSDEHKQKIGEKNRLNMMGRKATEETKRKMSAARKGKVIRTKNMVLNEASVYTIKTRLIAGQTAATIARDLDIDYSLINNMIANNTWSSVEVEGWDSYREHRPTYHRLSKEDHDEIYRLYVEEGYNKYELAELYDRGVKMIEKILRDHKKVA